MDKGACLLWVPVAKLYLAATGIAVYGPTQALLKGGPLTLHGVLAADAVFTAGAVLFLSVALRHGLQQHPRSAPYKGAWLDAQGRQQLPAGFARYLPLAGVVSFLAPASALLLAAATGRGAAASLLLSGYLGTFFVQALLETKLFHRNPVTPAIPFVFAPYRFFQLARSLWAVRVGAVPGAAELPWAPHMLLGLLAFWLFDYGVTASQLPWVFNWHLQPTEPMDGGGAKAPVAAGGEVAYAKDK